MNAVVEIDLYTRLWDAIHPEVRFAFDHLMAELKADGFGVSLEHNEFQDEYTIKLRVSERPMRSITRTIEFCLMSARLHEGEEGANIKLSSHLYVGGEWMEYAVYNPHNFTEKCWTSDPQELLLRFRDADLKELVQHMHLIS